MNGVVVVPRDKVCRWFTVVDTAGNEYRWMMIGDHNGTRFHTSLRGAAVSPVFWTPLSIRNWLIENRLRPKGSTSECWNFAAEEVPVPLSA